MLLRDHFSLDAPPELSLTPWIKQTVDAGLFLSEDEAAAAMHSAEMG
jgi:hypothetical protein